MNTNPNYSEWTREQKEEFAEQRMLLMKLKNAKLMQRHAEVEQDRIKAEEDNSAITNMSKVVSRKEKDGCALESNESEKKTQHTREWDEGKLDKEFWEPPEHHSSFKNYKTRHFEKKNESYDNFHDYSRPENKHKQGVIKFENFKNRSRRENYSYKYSDYGQQKNTSRSYSQMDHKTDKEKMYKNNETYWKPKKNYPEEKFKKVDYEITDSKRSLNKSWSRSCTSDSDSAILSNAKIPENASLWQNDKLTEDQNKQVIVQKWVTSTNKTNWNQKVSTEAKINIPVKSYSKFDRLERLDHSIDGGDDEDFLSNFNSLMQKNNSKVMNNQAFHENDQNWKKEMINKSSRDTDERRYVKKYDKFDSQDHLGRRNKNENFRNQRFESKGIKNDSKENFTMSKLQEHKSVSDDTWNYSELPKDDKCGSHSDSNYKNAASNVSNDGLWGCIEQSEIEWKLSDDESISTDCKQTKITSKDELRKDICREKEILQQRSKQTKPIDEKNQAYSDGGW